MCKKSEYLLTSVGALKVLHVIFGAFSIGLIADTFVPIQDEIIFASVVSVILLLSLLYLVAFLKFGVLETNAVNGKIDFIFHVAGSICLIIAGIDFSTWQDYLNICQESCPSQYTKGVAKILTFVNGVLYGIAAFLMVKEDELMKEEEITDSDLDDMEDFPLMSVSANSKGFSKWPYPGPSSTIRAQQQRPYQQFYHAVNHV